MARKHSAVSLAEFHKKRCQDNRVSKGKRFYSSRWLDGYNSSNAEENFVAARNSYFVKEKYGTLTRNDVIAISGYCAGCMARIKKDSAAIYKKKHGGA